MTGTVRVALAVTAISILRGQSGPVPRFEVASVKVSDSRNGHIGPKYGFGLMSGGPGTSDPELFTTIGESLRYLLRDAYNLKDYELDGQKWMQDDIYDVDAKVPLGTTPKQFREMLQNLLIDRFHIKLHRETRDLKAFDLIVASGKPKFKLSKFGESEPAASGPPLLKRDPDGFPVVADSAGPTTVDTRYLEQYIFTTNRSTMQEFADYLTLHMHRPIFDSTELKGLYAFSLHFMLEPISRPELPGGPLDNGPSVFSALRQLGLKLVPHPGSIDVLVVDKVDKIPVPN